MILSIDFKTKEAPKKFISEKPNYSKHDFLFNFFHSGKAEATTEKSVNVRCELCSHVYVAQKYIRGGYEIDGLTVHYVIRHSVWTPDMEIFYQDVRKTKDEEHKKFFIKTFEETKDEIAGIEQLAIRLLREAVAISDERGIPYRFEISPLCNFYKPDSFNAKFGDIRDDAFEELEEPSIDNQKRGWETSQIC